MRDPGARNGSDRIGRRLRRMAFVFHHERLLRNLAAHFRCAVKQECNKND